MKIVKEGGTITLILKWTVITSIHVKRKMLGVFEKKKKNYKSAWHNRVVKNASLAIVFLFLTAEYRCPTQLHNKLLAKKTFCLLYPGA